MNSFFEYIPLHETKFLHFIHYFIVKVMIFDLKGSYYVKSELVIVLRHTHLSFSNSPYFSIMVRTRNSDGYIDLSLIPWSINIAHIRMVVAYAEYPNLTAAIITLKYSKLHLVFSLMNFSSSSTSVKSSSLSLQTGSFGSCSTFPAKKI